MRVFDFLFYEKRLVIMSSLFSIGLREIRKCEDGNKAHESQGISYLRFLLFPITSKTWISKRMIKSIDYGI